MSITFQSLPDLVQHGRDNFKFRQNPRGAMAWNVTKATLGTMQTVVKTNRKWLKPHMQEGTRRPQSGGWVWKGREYLVVPILKSAFGKGGVMKSGFLANFYVVPQGSGGLIFYRAKRGAKQSQLIALLRPTVATHDRIDPDKVIAERFDRDATRLLRRYLASPRYKANPGGIF